jgi:hypothetical protein
MSMGVKRKPVEAAGETPFAEDSPLPGATPRSPASLVSSRLQSHYPHLVQCPHCRALNGHSALVCWSCETELSAIRRSASSPEVAPENPEVADPPAPIDSPAAAGAHDALEPTPEPAVQALAQADPPPPEPTPPARADVGHPMVVHWQPAAVTPWRRRVMVGVVALVVVVGADVYLRFRALSLEDLEATMLSGSALGSRETVTGPDRVEPTTTDRAPTGSTRPVTPDATPPAAVSTAPLEPKAQAAVEPEPRAVVRTKRPPRFASRSKESPASTAAWTERTAARSSDAMRSANAGGSARPLPQSQTESPYDPARRTSAPLGPCTAAVAALGLCAPPPQAKE